MSGQLVKKNHDVLLALRHAGVLLDVEKHLLDQSNGVILLTCSDGDRFCDIFRHQVTMQEGCRSDARIHVFAWHGGALACAPDSPINKIGGAHEVFLGQISDARALKGIEIIALYAHAPCGAAALADVDLEQAIDLQFRAKRKIREMNKGITVVCFFHVDYGDGKQRTYFLCRQKWEEWIQTRTIEIFV